MTYTVLENFTGVITGRKGQTMRIDNKKIAQDLLSAGYIKIYTPQSDDTKELQKQVSNLETEKNSLEAEKKALEEEIVRLKETYENNDINSSDEHTGETDPEGDNPDNENPNKNNNSNGKQGQKTK